MTKNRAANRAVVQEAVRTIRVDEEVYAKVLEIKVRLERETGKPVSMVKALKHFVMNYD